MHTEEHVFTVERIGSTTWRASCPRCGTSRTLYSTDAVVYYLTTGHAIAIELAIPA